MKGLPRGCWRRPFLWAGLGLAAALLLDRFRLLDDYVLLVLMLMGVNAILALSLNLVNGFMGEFSVGHAGFMATGAYIASLLTVRVLPHSAWAFPAALLAGGCGAALLGSLVALPSFRTRGDYLAIVTLAFNMIVKSVLENLPVLGGAQGFLGMEKSTTLPWVFAGCALGVWVVRNLVHSRFGRGILSIREDETAAELSGVDTRRVKLATFSLSAGLAGLAGGLQAHLLLYINPGAFDIVKSTEILVMVYLGGIGSIAGSLLGAAGYTLLQELLRPLGVWRMAAMPLLLILLMLFRPRGILGLRDPAWLEPRGRDEGKRDGGRDATALPPTPRVEAAPTPAAAGPPLLEIRGLGHRFAGLQALSGVDLRTAGGVHGVIGPNGAGKTTLFNLISGVHRPSEGSIRFRGREITGLRPCAITELGIARTFQNIRLYKDLSVLDNIRSAQDLRSPGTLLEAALRLGGHRAREGRVLERSRALLASFGLAELAREKARNLPYGLQRRLEILRALATEPRLLLLDEPAAGMLPREVDELMVFIRGLREGRNLAILLIEHQMRLVMGLCDRITVLDSGKVIAEGGPADIRSHPEVIRAYMGAGGAS